MILKPRLFSKITKDHPLSKGLVGYWLFNEHSQVLGQAFDYANGNHGIINGAQSVAGKFGNALKFDGDEDYVAVSGLVNHISKVEGTFVIWCTYDTAVLADGLLVPMIEIGSSIDDDDMIGIRKKTNDTIVLRYRKDDVSVDAVIGAAIAGFHQYVGTWGGGEVKIYLDGVLQATESINTITGTFDQAFIGRRGSTTSIRYFTGLVDCGSAYDRALSAGEVLSLFIDPFQMFRREAIELWAAASPPVGPLTESIDVSTGEFESGKGWVAFEEVDAPGGTQLLVSKDVTTGQQFFHIEKVVLCCGTGGNVGILDGSGAAMTPFRLYGDVSVGSRSQGWDFHGDPMILADSDSTCLCITATGKFYGFIKYSLNS